MNRMLKIALLSTLMLAASPAMAERYHDYRNGYRADRGQRYEGRSHSRSNWGVSIGFGFSNYNSYGGASYRYGNYSGCNDSYAYRPVYRPVYREAPVYRSCEPAPCNTYYAPVYTPVYDSGESYCSTPRYYSSPSYSYTNITYSSGGGSYYRGSSYYSNYSCPSTYYSGSVSFRYGR